MVWIHIRIWFRIRNRHRIRNLFKVGTRNRIKSSGSTQHWLIVSLHKPATPYIDDLYSLESGFPVYR
jgi:hypothetical protein